MAIVEHLNYEVIEDRGWDIKDPGLFDTAAGADLDDADYGFLDVPEGQYLFEAAGYRWPFSCRDRICSSCAAMLIDGEIEMDSAQSLSDEEIVEKGIRLTCVGRPTSDYLRLIYNAKHPEYLQDRIM